MRRLRREDCRKVPSPRPRQILAPRVSEVHMLWTSPRGHGTILLFQRRDDIMQKRLHKVSVVAVYVNIALVCLPMC